MDAKRPKYKAVIFDLDGTILDTLRDLTNSVNFALEAGNFPPRSADEVRSFVGNGVKNLILRALPDGKSDKQTDVTLSIFKEHYRTHCKDFTRPYDGIYELLCVLKNCGCSLAVVSNKVDYAVQALVKEYFGDIFDVVFGERDGVSRKPAPDSLFEVMGVLGVSVADVVYIGDSDVDILTAQNANIPCISVDWGFKSKEFLQECGAQSVASCVSDLYDFLIL